MIWRDYPNGDKFAPKRGKPPQPPLGYCVDSRDQYLAHPILKDCPFRFMVKETLSCGKIIGIIECSHSSIDGEVTQMRCFKCGINR